jgi:alpha-L-fucosidase 2
MLNSFKELDSLGTDYWCGYSYSWLGNLKARAKDGDGAAKVLKTFAECFCLPNSFHVNGDQSGTGKSKFTYRPFTLEGNFAFASGLQEMLLQSYSGIINIFPAIPKDWDNITFRNLRTEGAFLISVEKKDGKINKIIIYPEKGGKIKIKNPFDNNNLIISGAKNFLIDNVITIETKAKSLIKIAGQ